MKKTLSVLLALLLLLTAVACNKDDSEETNITTTFTTKQETSETKSSTTSTTTSSSTSATTTELAEPKDYAVAMEIFINPKFKLYLDKNFKTLYIKGLNDDAREVLKNFRFYGDETFETIVDSLIAKSKEAGYVKGNDVVNIQMFYMNKKSVNVEEMNNRMEALRKSMSQKYSAIIKFKVPSDVSTTSKTSTTKTTITTTTTTTKKPTTSTTKNVVVPTTVHPTVSLADTRSCIDVTWMADDNFSRTETSFQFQYDVFFGEVLNAKYPIAQINVISATVDGGRSCQIYQTNNKDKAYETVKKGIYDSSEYANFDDQLIAWNIAQIENVCRVVSPPLDTNKKYPDFTINLQVIFENGAVTTGYCVGEQSAGIGGWALGGLDDSDFQ